MDFDDRPIFMIRLVAESGCIMNGGAAQVGKRRRDRAEALLDELARLAGSSVPRLKISSMCGQLRDRLRADHVDARRRR